MERYGLHAAQSFNWTSGSPHSMRRRVRKGPGRSTCPASPRDGEAISHTVSPPRATTYPAITSSSGDGATAFLTGYALNGQSLRNDFTGWVGMNLTVGGSAIRVTALGRICLAGNSGTHTVKFVNSGTGATWPAARSR